MRFKPAATHDEIVGLFLRAEAAFKGAPEGREAKEVFLDMLRARMEPVPELEDDGLPF